MWPPTFELMSTVSSLRSRLRHAFAVETPESGQFDEAERELASRMASFIVRRRMTAPAIMLLETARPLNFLGSQFLAFVAPFATMLFSPDEYDHFVRFLEKRASVDFIIDLIAEKDSSGSEAGDGFE